MRFLSRRKNREKRTGKIRRLWRIAKLTFAVGIIAIVAISYYLNHLDRLIQSKFDQPRKWNLPSRVYSDTEYVYPGIDILKRRLVQKFDRLGYRNIGREINAPGDYSSSKDYIDIYLHDFAYPMEDFKGFPVRLFLDGTIITDMKNLDANESMSLVKLEPEEISPIFDVQMEDRTVISLKDVPTTLLEAIVMIEDERFFKHRGVDPIGILRAAAANVRSMRIVQGGSTLTQQLVKNFFLYPKKSILRKLNEMLIAVEMERHYTKGEILEAYLNEIYLGRRGSSSVAGVAEASKYYFAKNVGQLSISECALLAGMIRAPNEYSLLTHIDRAKARRDFVLKRLFDALLISKEQYTTAIAEPIIAPKPQMRAGRAPYFIDFLKQQLADLYPQEVLQSEGLKIFTTLDMTMQIAAEDALTNGLTQLEKKYANTLPKIHAGPLQGAFVAIQPANGYLRALVGGKLYSDSQFNRATQAMRQPGSAFKPFIYLTALDPRRSKQMFTPASIVEDKSFSVESGGKKWSPTNYDKKEHGPVTLRTALEQSLNIATAKLAIATGLNEVVNTARDAGITSPLEPVPSIALGSFEVTPIELASAYTIFPNGGVLAQPISIMHVTTDKGETLEKKAVKMRKVFDAGPVYLATNLMKGVIERGTASAARALGLNGIAAGKTGTTSNYKDAWFVGFTPELVALTWVGFDDNAPVNLSGARAALPMWAEFMKQMPSSQKDFPSPADIILVKIDSETGRLANGHCPNRIIEEAFIEGSEPKEPCE